MPFFAGIDEFIGEAVSGAASANAAAAANTSAPAFAGGPGRLRIEPDQVDAAIGIFQDAVNKLKEKVRAAQQEIRANPMAQDLVSQPAAHAFNHASMGGTGAAIAAWVGAVQEFESIITQLRAAKEANVRTDETVSQPFASA